jgi:hypothetical protein
LRRAKIVILVATILVFGVLYWLVATQSPREREPAHLRPDMLRALSTKVDIISGATKRLRL